MICFSFRNRKIYFKFIWGGLERILKIQNNFEKIKVKEIILPDLRLTTAIKTAHKTGIEMQEAREP